VRNPEDRKEATLKHFDYEHLSDKHKAFVKAKRFVQQDQWKLEGPKVLSECEPGDVVVCSRFSDKKPFYVLVQLKIKLKEQAVALPRRSSRSTATIATTASSSRARYELKAEVKAQIYERCRCW
jgi:hypothetical protein